MLTINDLKNGLVVVIDREPYVILSVRHQHIGRGGSSIQTKLRKLTTGQVLDRNFKPSDEFEEADIEKFKATYLYESRGIYWFSEAGNPKNRFSFTAEDLGDEVDYFKPNIEVTAIKFNEKIISVELPIKIDYKVTEAPPAVKGDTAQGGTKVVVVESGAKASVPLFISEGDVIRLNTQTGEYVERVEKGR